MENQNAPPQAGSFYGPSNTGEQMVPLEPLAPGSVFAPQNTSPNQLITQEIISDGVLESEYIAEQRQVSAQKPVGQPPPGPQSFNPGSLNTPGRGKFTYIIGFAAVLFIFLTGGGVLIFNKTSQTVVQAPAQGVPDQSIQLAEIVSSQDSLENLRPKDNSKNIIINANLVSTGSVTLFDGNNYGRISLSSLKNNQTYELPDSSGEFCLDSNNCDYASTDNVVNSIGGARGVIGLGGGLSIQGGSLVSSTGVITSLNGVSGGISLGSGLSISGSTLTSVTTLLNGSSGSITIQGTTNQVQVVTSGSVVTLTTPQDIATSSSPNFQTITLAAAGTQNGNAICDISNNCGYAGGANSFVQGGNSFGATSILGTNDSFGLSFETAGVSRGQFTTDGAFVLDGVVSSGINPKLHVPYVAGDGISLVDPFNSSTIDVLSSFGSSTDITNDTVAVFAESYSNIGVYGLSVDGTAIQGVSVNGDGVYGITVGANSSGVVGWNLLGDGYGVRGSGQGLFGGGDSIGVGAFGGDDYGLYATSYNQTSAYFQASEATICFFGCVTYVPTQPTVVIQQLNAETADLLELQMSDNSPVFQVGYNGHTAIGSSASIDQSGYDMFIIDGAVTLLITDSENVLSINETFVSTPPLLGVQSGINSSVQANYSTDSSGLLVGINNNTEVSASNTGVIPGVFGFNNHVKLDGSADIGQIQGINNTVDARNLTGNVSSFILGSLNTVNTSVNGNTSVAYGEVTGVQHNGDLGFDLGLASGLVVAVASTGAGSITDARGLAIESASGNIENNYGIYVSDQSSAGTTSSYNIYSQGSGYNLFQGHTAIGNTAATGSCASLGFGSCSTTLQLNETVTDFVNPIWGIDNVLLLSPSANVGRTITGSSNTINTFSNVDFTDTISSQTNRISHSGSGAVARAYATELSVANNSGIIQNAISAESAIQSSNTSIIANAVGFNSTVSALISGNIDNAYGYKSLIETTFGGVIDNAYGLQTETRNNATVSNNHGIVVTTASNFGTMTNNYGIWAQAQTAATNDYGVRIDTADTQTLWLSGDANNTTASAGIAFGSSRDTNLYRSAADRLRTDDSFEVGGVLSVSDGNSADPGITFISSGYDDGFWYDDGDIFIVQSGTSDSICVLSANNCGYASAATAFVQGGNSFAATAVLGTNDANDLVFETSNTARLTVTSGGDVNINNDLDIGSQLAVGSTSSVISNVVATFSETYTGVAGSLIGVATSVLSNPAGASSAVLVGSGSTAGTQAGNIQNHTGVIIGTASTANHDASGSLSTLVGTYSIAGVNATAGAVVNAIATNSITINASASSVDVAAGVIASSSNTGTGTIGTNIGLQAQSSNAGTVGTADIAWNIGLAVNNSLTGAGDVAINSGISVAAFIDSGAGNLTDNYGINVVAQTAGVNDYGISVGAADTQTLWLSSNADNTTEAAGIAFGSSRDTSIYRGGANTLRTSDSFIIDGNVGVNNTTAPNRLNINTLTTADPDAELAVSTGADDQKGIIVQGVAGQTVNLQEWQDDAGDILASVDAVGDLYVQNAVVDGNLTVVEHIHSTGPDATVVDGANVGVGANVTTEGTDIVGTVSIETGTGSTAGQLAEVTFDIPYAAGYESIVTLTPLNGDGATLQYYVTSTDGDTFSINSNNAPTDSTTYIYNYHVISFDDSD